MSLAIAGLGTALPATKITQEEAARIAQILYGHSAEQPNRLPSVYRQSGIGHKAIASRGVVS